MFKWFRQSSLDPLAVSMAGAKLGDRVLIVGGSDPPLVAALAQKPGLTGHVSIVDDSAERADAAGRHALAEGALVETKTASLDAALPYESGFFDLVVLRSVLDATVLDARVVLLDEALRLLRPGGRCLAVEATESTGVIGRLFASKQSDEPSPAAQALTRAFKGHGFAAARTLAERDGLAFVEGIKPTPTGHT